MVWKRPKRNRAEQPWSNGAVCRRAPLEPARRRGITLVEALISVVVLAFAATIAVGLYAAGLQALRAQGERAQLDSLLRGRMERLLSEKFDSPQPVDGSEQVTVNGKIHTIAWSVANMDLDGDTIAEVDAKQILVTLGGRSLTTLVVNSAGLVGKI